MVNYTTINHVARERLGLSWLEYGLADLIYNLSNNPKNPAQGWCYASKPTLAKILGISEREIFRMLNKLIEVGLVEKQEQTKYLKTNSNWYEMVVIKTHDKMAVPMTESQGDTDQMSVLTHDQMSVYKDNNNKDIYKDKKYSSLSHLTEKEFSLLSEKFQVPVSFVLSKLEDLTNYCEAKGKRYKNYFAALTNFVKKDSIQIRKEANGRSKITIITPDPDWNTEGVVT